MKTIAYFGGLWAPNIGNAFYNLGVIHALKKALPDANITMLGDQPGWVWGYGLKEGRRNVLIDDIETDYAVISGPVLTTQFQAMWGDTLMKLRARGTKILFLSLGANRYTPEEYKVSHPVLKECRPHVILTRDSSTFDMYSEFAEHSYDGICFAFMSPDYLPQPLKIDSNYFVVNFDKGQDYNVLEEYNRDLTGFLEGGEWSPNGRHKPLKRSRAASRIEKFGDHQVVRTHHEFTPALWRKLAYSYLMGHSPFRKPNCFVSDVPEGYLHLYQQTPLTISERVHACVPTVAYGNHAWLISKTKRARLFTRVGLDEITERPVRADLESLALEKQGMIDFLRKTL